MNNELSQFNCPICTSVILVDKEHVITCSKCGNEVELVRHEEKVVSIRRLIYAPGYYITNDLSQIIIDLVEKNLSPEQWGFHITHNNQKGTVIYDSKDCRVKFVLESSDYFPQHDTKIFYGRLYAPDNEYSIIWNGKNCRCWHQNILGLTLPFIEGMSPQHLVENLSEFWKPLVEKLNVNYPSSDYVEYPLRLHSKIWDYYKEKLFSVFDLRNPDIWEKYSRFSIEFDDAFNKKHNLSRRIEEIC